MSRSPTIAPRTALREVRIVLSQHRNEPPVITLTGTPMTGSSRIGMQSEVKVTTHHLSPLGQQWLAEMMGMFGGESDGGESGAAASDKAAGDRPRN